MRVADPRKTQKQKHARKPVKAQKRAIQTKKQAKKFAPQKQKQFSPKNIPQQQQQIRPFTADTQTQRNMNRSSTSLYRDCLRLIDYMAGRSTKADRLRDIIRGEFEKNKDETDPNRIEQLKGSAVQGLANYLTVESLARSGNKYTGPAIQQDQSLFARRRQAQSAEHGHDLQTLQELEMDGPQEFRGVRITPGSFGEGNINTADDNAPGNPKSAV